MKFWKKTFLAVLIPFIIGINVAIFFITHINYSTMLSNEVHTTALSAYYVAESFYTEFAVLDGWDILSRDNKKHVFSDLAALYKRNGVLLQYWEDDKPLFTIGGVKELDINWEKASDTTGILTNGKYAATQYNGNDYLVIRMPLSYPYTNSEVVYIHPMEGMTQARQNMLWAAIAAEGVIILAAAVILYVMLRKMMKPLQRLSDATRDIAKGEYGKKIEIRGKDEIALLAQNFNEMSDSLEEKIEQLRQSDLEKQQFIDNLGHELRTPLTTISGYAEYLQMAPADEEEKLNALGYIISEAKRLGKLSDSLLKLALLRVDEIEKKEIPFTRLTDKLVDGFAGNLAKKGIALCIDKREGILIGNEELVYSLLANLVENASRACEEKGHIYVSIEEYNEGAYEERKNGLTEFTRIRIRDDGIGMREEEVQRISEPFYRADKARSRKSGGLGLGMTLCRQIVMCHDGSMECDSVFGEGTAVTVLLRNWK